MFDHVELISKLALTASCVFQQIQFQLQKHWLRSEVMHSGTPRTLTDAFRDPADAHRCIQGPHGRSQMHSGTPRMLTDAVKDPTDTHSCAPVHNIGVQ